MIQKKKHLFLKTLRVLLQDEDVSQLGDTRKYSLITVISYKPLSLSGGFNLKKKEIINIYLDGSIEEIVSGFNRSTRQEIKKTYDIKDLTFIVDDKDLDAAYELYKEFEYAQDRTPWRKDSFKNTVLFDAYYNDKLISSVAVYDIFPYFQIRAMFSKRLSASTQDGDLSGQDMRKIISYSTRRLIYEICKYAKEKRYTFVGLGAINFSDPQKARVAKFKTFFGGKVEHEYTYTYKSKWFRVLERLMNMKLFLLKLFRS